MYKFGFFYNLPETISQARALFLCYVNHRFCFYSVKKHVLPRKYQRIHSDYYSFSFPVICNLDNDEISEFYFIEDLPLLSDRKCKSPFKLEIEENNRARRPSAKLYFKRKEFQVKFSLSNDEKRLMELLTNYGAAKKRIAELFKACSYITPERYDWDDFFVMYDLLHKLNSVDFKSILSSLYVEVRHCYVYSRSKSDYEYLVRRTARLDDGIVLDKYLRELIGLGEDVVIYENFGYKCNEEKESVDFIQAHPVGVYKGRQLQREKKRIISKYSRECHMASLIFEEIGKQREAEYISECWRKKKLYCADIIDEEFTSKISSLHESLYFNMEYKKDFMKLINNAIDRVQRLPGLTVWFLQDDSTNCIDSESKIYSKVQSLLENYNVQLIVGHQYQLSQLVRKCKDEYLLESYVWTNPYINKRISVEEQIDEKITSLMQHADMVCVLGSVEDVTGPISKKIISQAKEKNILIENI